VHERALGVHQVELVVQAREHLRPRQQQPPTALSTAAPLLCTPPVAALSPCLATHLRRFSPKTPEVGSGA
jgi:hypothetical protein